MMIKTNPMDPEWKKRLGEQGMTAETRLPDEEYETLKQILLSFGGEAVVIDSEPYLEKIMDRGELFSGDGALFRKGNRNRCHENAGSNFAQHGDLIATDYALPIDGVWRQHSWNIDKDNGTVIETTEPWIVYFGFVLDENECQEFAEENPVTDRMVTCEDDDYESREFVLVANPDQIGMAVVDGPYLEIQLPDEIPDDVLEGGVSIILRGPEGKYSLAARLEGIEKFGMEDEGPLPMRFSGGDFRLLDKPVEIAESDLIARLDTASSDENLIEIPDEGPESSYLLDLAWPDDCAPEED